MKKIAFILAAAGSVSAFGSTPFTSIYNDQFAGASISVAGAPTRQFGTTFFGNAPQTDPFTLNMGGIVGVPKAAFVSWNYLTSSPGSGDEARIRINGIDVFGTSAGVSSPDLCWGHSNVASYWADVTAIVQTYGNGAYKIETATDDPFDGAYGEGLSMLAVYADPSISAVGDVEVWVGNANNTAGAGAGMASLPLSRPYLGGPVHLFINALDGQRAPDEFYINGSDVSGIFDGTAVAGDAWQGLLGPGAVDNLYDHACDDASPWMHPGDLVIEAGTPALISDCIGHTFAAIALQCVPSPGALGVLGVAAMGAGRRRR